MNKRWNIAVFTSIRSEYGILKPFLSKVVESKDFELSLLAGGAHLSPEYGLTIQEIEGDGFSVRHRFPFLCEDGSVDASTRSMAELGMQISGYFSKTLPDLFVVLGDRFELLPVVNAALVRNIPIGHISGGEITEGAIDNQVRHAISKMANLHFPATEASKMNLVQMGEEGWRICVSGELGLDEVLNMDYIPKERLFAELGLKTGAPVICATFHSETITHEITPDFVQAVLRKVLRERPSTQILVTAANFDTGGPAINAALERMAGESPRIRFVKSLGKLKYFSLLKSADAVLGNSSSGLVEAQSFNIPVVDVGKRQQGRVANANVVHVEAEVDKVLPALEHALSDVFRSGYYNRPNLYGKGNGAGIALEFIRQNLSRTDLLMKRTQFNLT